MPASHSTRVVVDPKAVLPPKGVCSLNSARHVRVVQNIFFLMFFETSAILPDLFWAWFLCLGRACRASEAAPGAAAAAFS